MKHAFGVETRFSQFESLMADTLMEDAVKKRGYFEPKKVNRLLENMLSTREFVFCKQVASFVVIDLGHRGPQARAAGLIGATSRQESARVIQTLMSVFWSKLT